MIFIPGNVPSSKNSKIATSKGVFHSKTVSKYLRNHGIKSYSVTKQTVTNYVRRPDTFVEYVLQFKELFKDNSSPYIIGIHFVRDSKRIFDFHNIFQIIADLLVAYKGIEGDDMNNIVVVPIMNILTGKYYSIDKLNPGVYIFNINKLTYEFKSCFDNKFVCA